MKYIALVYIIAGTGEVRIIKMPFFDSLKECVSHALSAKEDFKERFITYRCEKVK